MQLRTMIVGLTYTNNNQIRRKATSCSLNFFYFNTFDRKTKKILEIISETYHIQPVLIPITV